MSLPVDFQFSGPRDLQTLKRIDAEAFYQRFAPLLLERIVPVGQTGEPAQQKTLNIYKEPMWETAAKETEAYKPRYLPEGPFPFFVELSPSAETLGRYGIDVPRDAVVVFSIALLEIIGYWKNPTRGTPKKGDRFRYNNREYEIMGLTEEDYWGNSQTPLHLSGTANKATERDMAG